MTDAAESSIAALLPGGFHAFNPQTDFSDNTVTNASRPLTDAVITVRIIKSFEYRSMKAYVLKNIDLTTTTVAQLEEQCRTEVKTNSAFRAFRSYADQLDTLKLYTKAHGSKTTNLIINLDHPEWLLEDENLSNLSGKQGKTKQNTTLAEIGVENETELSLMNKQAYEAFFEPSGNKVGCNRLECEANSSKKAMALYPHTSTTNLDGPRIRTC